MDDNIYDEFGNLIEGEIYDSDANDGAIFNEEENSSEQLQTKSTSLVRADLLSAFDEDVEVLVETEDQQSLNIPLVKLEANAKPEHALFSSLKKKVPKTTFDSEYMLELLQLPERIRNVAVIGPLHSGKTSLVDLIVLQSHENLPYVSHNVRQGWKPLKFMDNTKLEIERGVTCKLNGMTTLGTDLQDKSVAITFLDSPGHVGFMDEVAVALAASDCCLIVIDIVEGITSVAQQLIKQAQRHGLRIVFVLNKIDRLILELKLPPNDAFLKLKFLVDQINSFAKDTYSPELGNIVFASAKLGFTFTIKEFVLRYYGHRLDKNAIHNFVERLWGNVYFEAGSFSTTPNARNITTFVEFILLPIYKIFTHSLSSNPESLAVTLKKEFKVSLPVECFKNDPLPLLRQVVKLIFKEENGLIDAINLCCLSSHETSPTKLKFLGIKEHNESILAHVLKFADFGGQYWSLVRIYKGTIKTNDTLKITDTGSTGEDSVRDVKIKNISLMGGRYMLPVTQATEGQIVLINGLEDLYTKSATLSSSGTLSFRPLDYINSSVFKIVVQPYHPRELPQLLDGLNTINKLYPGVIINVEETGENVILGSGELYLDCLLYELRTNYGGIEIRASNPLTRFSESCLGESFASIPVKTSNGQVTLSVGAQPLDRKLVHDLENGVLKESDIENARQLSKRLRNEYGWDSLEARNVWSFYNSNVFVDDTIPDEVDKNVLSSVKDAVIQGFQWSTKEGPLAEEPIHGVHFRLLNVSAVGDIHTGQLIPLARKACYVGLLTAQPAILEPIYQVDIIVHEILTEVIEELLRKRRGGRIYETLRIPATSLVEIKAQLPVIESIGFETDLRLATNGGGMCQLQFWNKIWRKVPGDVMEENAYIPKLKPAPIESLSRDFVMKTRRRKGLSSEGYASQDGPSLSKYIDNELFQKLKDSNLVQ